MGRPSCANRNQACETMRDIELSANRPKWHAVHSESADVIDDGPGQLSLNVILTNTHAIRMNARRIPVAGQRAAFDRHVAHVVGIRPQEQMVGTDTGRVVAVMADQQAGWNRAVSQLPGVAMSRNRAMIDLELTIVSAGRISPRAAAPDPATVGLFNEVPESPVSGTGDWSVCRSAFQPTCMVHVAPSAFPGELGTIGNGTLSLHGDLHCRRAAPPDGACRCGGSASLLYPVVREPYPA